jgi:hypothetical protein
MTSSSSMRVVAEERPREPDRVHRHAQERLDAGLFHAGELHAAAPEVQHERIAHRQARARGLGPEPGLLLAGQHLDVHLGHPGELVEQAVAVRGVPDRGGAHREHAVGLVAPERAQEPPGRAHGGPERGGPELRRWARASRVCTRSSRMSR